MHMPINTYMQESKCTKFSFPSKRKKKKKNLLKANKDKVNIHKNTPINIKQIRINSNAIIQIDIHMKIPIF